MINVKSIIRHIIEETRKHGYDQYQSVESIIHEYSKKPDSEKYFIHHSGTFADSSKQLLNQISINFTGTDRYENPFGIYAFPMDIVRHITDGRRMDYAYVIKVNNVKWLSDINDMSKDEYLRCLDVISNEYNADEFYSYVNNITDNKKTFGHNLHDIITNLSTNTKYNNNQSMSVFQTKIWFSLLGYYGICDRGDGILWDDTEPSQAVFFTSKAFEVIDVVKNRHYGKSMDIAVARNDIGSIIHILLLGGRCDINCLQFLYNYDNFATLTELINDGKYRITEYDIKWAQKYGDDEVTNIDEIVKYLKRMI